MDKGDFWQAGRADKGSEQSQFDARGTMRHKRLLVCGVTIALGLLHLSCNARKPEQRSGSSVVAQEIRPALRSISRSDLLGHIRVLAADDYEGRAPGTRGEGLTVSYLTGQFQGLGLQPGNPDGTFEQTVPLAGLTAKSTASLIAGGKKLNLRFPDDYVAVTRRFVPEVKVHDSEIVFVGYGVVAPEYDWDDYKGVDVKGKTLLMLINDPAVPDPRDPARLDDKIFKGRAMTYYGRWTYKYEMPPGKARQPPSSFTRPVPPAIPTRWSPVAGGVKTSISRLRAGIWTRLLWKPGSTWIQPSNCLPPVAWTLTR